MRMRVSILACALAGGTIFVSAAGAQSTLPSGAAGLSAAMEAAWQRAVLARETDSQRRRALADQVAARSWASGPPSVEFGYRDDRWQSGRGNREGEVGLAWPLWLPSQRAASDKLAQVALDLAAASEQAARLRLAGEVREAFWSTVAYRAGLIAAEAQATALQQLAADVDRRVGAGELARADALAARAEHLEASSQRAEAAQRVAAARLRWTALTGLATLPSVPAGGDSSPTALPANIDDHPELRLARRAAQHASRRLELTLASRREAPEVHLGVRQETPERGESRQHSVSLRVRIPIGTAARNEPLQAAASGDFEVAQVNEQRTRDRLAAELAIARNALDLAEQQLGVERERSALLRERAKLIDRAFRAGESSLPDTLRALAAAAQADAALARLEAASGLAHARLHQALGVIP